MKIVMAHQTHANLTFVLVDRTKNAPEESIHVEKGNANAARMKNVRTRKLVGLENAEVSNFKCSKTCIIYFLKYASQYFDLKLNVRYVDINKWSAAGKG